MVKLVPDSNFFLKRFPRSISVISCGITILPPVQHLNYKIQHEIAMRIWYACQQSGRALLYDHCKQLLSISFNISFFSGTLEMKWLVLEQIKQSCFNHKVCKSPCKTIQTPPGSWQDNTNATKYTKLTSFAEFYNYMQSYHTTINNLRSMTFPFSFYRN